jgi:hypothetical protein
MVGSTGARSISAAGVVADGVVADVEVWASVRWISVWRSWERRFELLLARAQA